MLTVVTPQEPTPAAMTGGSLIDEIVRDGARRMLAAALEVEVAAYATHDQAAAVSVELVGVRSNAAQARWRAVNAPHLVALVRAGACFERGQLVERTGQASFEVAA